MMFIRFLEKHLCLVVQMLCDSSDFSPSHILGCAAICERAAVLLFLQIDFCKMHILRLFFYVHVIRCYSESFHIFSTSFFRVFSNLNSTVYLNCISQRPNIFQASSCFRGNPTGISGNPWGRSCCSWETINVFDIILYDLKWHFSV